MSEDWEKKYWQNREKQIAAQRTAKSDWKEVDPVSAVLNNLDGLQSRNMGPQSSKSVSLKPGAVYYKVVSNSFGTTIPLVKSCGNLQEGTQTSFEMMAPCRCYIVDHMSPVDLANMDPNKLVTLIQIRSAFSGILLVEASSIINHTDNGSRQVLKG